MSEINRVVFTGDILRPFQVGNRWESATRKNIRWLKHLIEWQISKATALPQSVVIWEQGGFDPSSIYQDFRLDIGYEAWATIFYLSSLPAKIEKKLIEPFAGACVVGVELPDVLQMALTRHQIPFIDIIGHPVRFMEDLLFGFRTNDAKIHERLLRYQINLDDYCVPRANLLQAKVAWLPSMNLPQGTALIAGQVSTDKALICRKRGRFLNLGDFQEQLAEIIKRHPLVLFKPHPYQDANCPSRKAVESLGVTREVKQNFYYLLGQLGLTTVYAINSGTVSEAHYFGREGRCLGEPLYSFGEKFPSGDQGGDVIPLGLAFLEPTFWADILEPIVAVKRNLPAGPQPRESLLRRSLNADWDYGFIDAVVQKNF